jgi:hypothetical protein
MQDRFLKTGIFLAPFHPLTEFDAGPHGDQKTDWFDLQEAHLQLQSYSQPMIAQSGGLAGDQEKLRADGALRPPALSAQSRGGQA